MSEEITEGTNAVEAKLAEAGADDVRRYSFSDAPEAAPEEGTPAETQLRNELGQFAAQEEEAPAEVAEVAGGVEEPVAPGQDPAVAAFLGKYGGDVDKALAGAVHLQRKSGEQSNEVGELRQMVSELQALRETVQADYQTRQSQTPLDQGTVDWYDQQVLQNPHAALEWARQQGNSLLIQRGLDTWKDVDPYGASTYTNQLQNLALQQQMEARLSQVAQIPMDSSVHLALANVRSKHPELVNYDDAIESTLQKHPFAAQAFESAAASGDKAQLEGAIETLYSLAVGDTLRDQALTGPAPENTTTSEGVVVPTTSETHEPAPEASPTDRFREAFRQEADRTRKGVWVAD